MIELGQKVVFDPWQGQSGFGDVAGRKVEGTVVLVHPSHNYFTVEYKLGDKKFKTSFHFADVFGKYKCVWLAG